MKMINEQKLQGSVDDLINSVDDLINNYQESFTSWKGNWCDFYNIEKYSLAQKIL